MPDYAKMYAILCGAISDALDEASEMDERSQIILQQAMLRTEELYISNEDN